MKVNFPSQIFPNIIQTLLNVRNQELKGNINYALTRILTALQPDWKAFCELRDPLVARYQNKYKEISEQLKDEPEKLRAELSKIEQEFNDEYQETFKDSDIEIEIKPLKIEYLESISLKGNDGDIIALFIEDEKTDA